MYRSSARMFGFLLSILYLALNTGCVSVEKQPIQRSEAVFFPPPPEKPRIQYLRSFTGSQDIEEGQSAFDAFITGTKRQGERLDKPYGVAIHDGVIYVADSNFSVMTFDLRDSKYKRLEGAKGVGQLIQPLNIHIDEKGFKYVADPARSMVLVYDRNDFYVKSYGDRNWRPVDVATSSDRVYVADRKNGEIKVFDKMSGALLKAIGSKGDNPEKLLSIPIGITVDGNGNIYVSDMGRFQVVVYDRDGNFINSFGEPCRRPGCFARPRGLAADRKGRLYAVDAAFENVQIFMAEEGQVLTYFGGPGNSPGNLFLPAAVTIDYDNVEYFRDLIDPNFEVEYLVIVTSQFGDRAVNVYGFGKQKGVAYEEYRELKKRAKERLEEFRVERPEEN